MSRIVIELQEMPGPKEKVSCRNMRTRDSDPVNMMTKKKENSHVREQKETAAMVLLPDHA